MLRTGSIRSTPSDRDGVRISVMSRHTLNDGVTPDPEITEDKFSEHWPQLAPHPRQVGAWYRSGQTEEDWSEFKGAYLERLSSDVEVRTRMAELAGMALRGDVTILCVEEQAHHCHRKLLAEEMERNFPGLAVIIR